MDAAGPPLVRDRIYKHFSTVYSVELCADLGGGRLRPLQLVGLALTNQPNNPGQRPITNSQAAPINDNTNQQDNNMEELKKIAAKLGLPEDAALDQILATIDALMAAEQEAAEAEAETLLNSEDLATLTPEEKKDLKEELLTNREMGIKMINLLYQPQGRRHVRGRSEVCPARISPGNPGDQGRQRHGDGPRPAAGEYGPRHPGARKGSRASLLVLESEEPDQDPAGAEVNRSWHLLLTIHNQKTTWQLSINRPS